MAINKVIIFLLVGLSSLASPLTGRERRLEATSASSILCAKELNHILAIAQKLPETNQIFEKVLEDGPLYIEVNRHISKEFEGYWSDDERTIYLTKTRSTTDGMLIATLVFELHNAYRNHELRSLTKKAEAQGICKEDFVRQYEYVEFKNAKDAQRLVNLGIERGIYPYTSSIDYHDNFEDHYALQQRVGHSAWIGNMYDGYYYQN